MQSFGMVCPHAERVVQFLLNVGLEVRLSPSARGFIDGVAIVDGALLVDSRARASGLLHEAGHLAIIPNRFRSYLSGNISSGIKRIFSELDALQLSPDDHLERALINTGDPEATAWAWAVGKQLNIPEDLIIQDDEYEGGGEWVRSALAANCYIGINGLSHAGFCVVRHNPYLPCPVYPDLAYWLQTDCPHTPSIP